MRLLTLLIIPLLFPTISCSRPVSAPRTARGPSLRVMTYNLNFGLEGDAAGIAAIAAGRADLVFLQESTPGWERQIRARLGHRYPWMAFHHEEGAGGLAVLSRYPFSGEVISSAAGWFPAWRVIVRSPIGRLQVLQVHLRPPVSDGGSWVSGYFTTRSFRRREAEHFTGRLDLSLPTLDELHDLGRRLHLLPGGLRVHGGERRGLPAAEAEMDLRRPIIGDLHQRHVLDQVGKHSLPLAVRCRWVGPEPSEVRRHRDEALADSLVDGHPVLGSCTLAFVSRLRQRAKPFVPVRLERVGDQPIGGVDHHEAALREVSVDLCPLDRTTSKLVRLVVSSFDLPPDFERELDRGRRHLLGHQVPHRFIDWRACERLAVWLGPGIGGAIADVPGLELAARIPVANAHLLTAATADGAALQKRGPLARRRCARDVVAVTVRSKQPKVLLISVPADVPGVGVGDAGEPIVTRALPQRLLPLDRPAVGALAVSVGAGVPWVAQGPHRRRRRERAEEHAGSRGTQARREAEALGPKRLDGLVRRADPGERFEEVRDRFPHLRVRIQDNGTVVVVDEAGGKRASVLTAPDLVQDPAS